MQDKLDHDKRVKASEDQDHPKEEQDLDEALYDSFPASDPVSVVQKGEPTSPVRGEDVDRKQKADKMKKD